MRLYRAPSYVRVAALGLAIAATTRAAAALSAVCNGPSIHIEQQLSPAWRAAADQLAVDLALANDWDRCAAVAISPMGNEVIVQVDLQDGRSAVRRVHGPLELSSTVEAVLLIPPAAAPRSSVKEDERAERDVEPAVNLLPRSNRQGAADSHIEIGLAADTRASGAPLFWGAGMQFNGQVSLNGWVIAADAHWDVFDAPVTIVAPAGFNMQTVAVGVGVGRRIESAALRADVVLGPELVVENEEADGAGDGVGGSTNDVRIHVTARLLPVQAKAIRWFGALDADASPARIRHATRVDLAMPTSPAWSAGLSLGLLWEVR